MSSRPTFSTIDEYIHSFPTETQKILSKIRQTIKKELPENMGEGISYAIPTFKVNGHYVIYFAAYDKHIGVYPIPEGSVEFNNRIAPYVHGKGTLRFPLNEDIPYELIAEMTRFALKRNKGLYNKKKK